MGKAEKLAAPRPNPATYREGVDPPVRAEPLLLVVCHNRELATQVFDESRRFCYRSMLRPCVVYGGGPRIEQIRQLQRGCDVLIATPGRLCEFIEDPRILSLHRLRYMIIDEADEMLDAGWEAEFKKIMTAGSK
jgi:ATP-dependent RNA helicase DDX3X